jgi:hypothetical protein
MHWALTCESMWQDAHYAKYKERVLMEVLNSKRARQRRGAFEPPNPARPHFVVPTRAPVQASGFMLY